MNLARIRVDPAPGGAAAVASETAEGSAASGSTFGPLVEAPTQGTRPSRTRSESSPRTALAEPG